MSSQHNEPKSFIITSKTALLKIKLKPGQSIGMYYENDDGKFKISYNTGYYSTVIYTGNDYENANVIFNEILENLDKSAHVFHECQIIYNGNNIKKLTLIDRIISINGWTSAKLKNEDIDCSELYYFATKNN